MHHSEIKGININDKGDKHKLQYEFNLEQLAKLEEAKSLIEITSAQYAN